MKKLRGLFIVILLLTLAACSQGQELTPVVIEMHTLTPTVTPTRTPIWFPATETPTLMPTLTLQPTADFRPGTGSVLLSDDFASGGWQTLKNEAGSVAFGLNELTIAISLPKGVLSSLRTKPLPANAYIEITMTPSLCSGGDVYGLYLRAASSGDGYRLLAACDGRLRMERLKNQELVILRDWAPGIGMVPGGMLPIRLGVWADGLELRIFINDNYQFTIRDPVYPEGQIGIYARASSDRPLTVSFSSLVVRTLDLSRIPTATPQPTAAPQGN